MIRRIFAKLNRRGKKGFTLIECIVSIAIFTILATMFASFMINSVRVVNLSIANDEDRELLLEAIAQAKTDVYTNEEGKKVTITTYANSLKPGDTKDTLTLTLDFGDPTNTEIKLDDNYLIYTTEEGTKYCIYLGTAGEEKPPETGFDEGTLNGKTSDAENDNQGG